MLEESQVRKLINEYMVCGGASDDLPALEKLAEIGQVDHPLAAEFLVSGSIDGLMKGEIFEYQIIMKSFVNYLRRGNIDENLLRKMANQIVEISQMPDEQYGTYRPAVAREAIRILQEEGNPVMSRVLNSQE